MKKWYEELFENSAQRYDEEPFVKGTVGEVDFNDILAVTSFTGTAGFPYPLKTGPLPDSFQDGYRTDR